MQAQLRIEEVSYDARPAYVLETADFIITAVPNGIPQLPLYEVELRTLEFRTSRLATGMQTKHFLNEVLQRGRERYGWRFDRIR